MKATFGAAILTLVGACWPANSGMLINGAGATFPAPIYLRWFSDFQHAHFGMQINYQPLGSGVSCTPRRNLVASSFRMPARPVAPIHPVRKPDPMAVKPE
jgi:hypothetical protein